MPVDPVLTNVVSFHASKEVRDIRVAVYPPDYELQPYERELSISEIKSLIPGSIVTSGSPMIVRGVSERDLPKLRRLTYANRVVTDDGEFEVTQHRMEGDDRSRKRNTRYSTHGIHRYRGKFNPQISSYLLNIVGADSGTRVLEPFCGSGTTMLECAHRGITATGMDINPLAVLITNTKLQSLSIDTVAAKKTFDDMAGSFNRPEIDDSKRSAFLRKWLPPETLDVAEYIREYTEELDGPVRDLIRLTASNQFEYYSNQRPHAPRGRMRKTPLPKMPYRSAIRFDFEQTLRKIDYYQRLGLPTETQSRAFLCDVTDPPKDIGTYDCSLCSPPYTTAIPYIGMLRINLVWFGMLDPGKVGDMESSLIGSRNEKGQDLEDLSKETEEMLDRLPSTVIDLISKVSKALRPDDEFRKQTSPHYLARYFDSMREMFMSVHGLVREEGMFKLVVGANRSTVDRRIFIDTPKLLGDVAAECGWDFEKLSVLQTFSTHGKDANAAEFEKILELRRSV